MAILRCDLAFLTTRLFPETDCKIVSVEYAPNAGQRDVKIELTGAGVPNVPEVSAIIHASINTAGRLARDERVEFVPVGP